MKREKRGEIDLVPARVAEESAEREADPIITMKSEVSTEDFIERNKTRGFSSPDQRGRSQLNIPKKKEAET